MPNQSLFDETLKTQLDLNRVEAGLRWQAGKILDDMRKGIKAKIQAGDVTEWGKRRFNQFLAEANETIENGYQTLSTEMIDEMRGIGTYTATATATAITAIVPPSLGVGLPPASYIEALAGDAIIQGATQSAWWSKQSKDLKWNFQAQMRTGLVQGETNDQLLARIVGKPGMAGIMDVSKRNALSLVHTSAQTVANNARQAVFEENQDIIPKVRWISTLDSRVCVLCAARADKRWYTKTHAPIGHGIGYLNPPIHFRDRCVLIGEVATFRDLGIDIDEPANGKRASIIGPVAADTTFDGFLKRMGPGFQDMTLGPGRADLWRSGKITLEQLIDGNGKKIKISDLL